MISDNSLIYFQYKQDWNQSINLITTIGATLNAEVNPESCQIRDWGVSFVAALQAGTPLLCAPFLLTPLLILPPTSTPPLPRSLPLHRVNPEPAVPDRANPKDPYKRQRGQKDQRQWGQPQKPALDKWARVKFYEGNSSIEKNSPSAEKQLVPRLKAGEEREEGLDSKEEQRKSDWNDKMRRWVMDRFKDFIFFLHIHTFCHTLAHIYCSVDFLAVSLPAFAPADAWVLCGVINKTHLLS